MRRRGDGGAAHFGGGVVALEKDEVFKSERVHPEYSRAHGGSPADSSTANAFEGCVPRAGWKKLPAPQSASYCRI